MARYYDITLVCSLVRSFFLLFESGHEPPMTEQTSKPASHRRACQTSIFLFLFSFLFFFSSHTLFTLLFLPAKNRGYSSKNPPRFVSPMTVMNGSFSIMLSTLRRTPRGPFQTASTVMHSLTYARSGCNSISDGL